MEKLGIAAVSEMADTKVVVTGAPSSSTTELATKPVPATVSENAAPPTATLAGVMPVIVGAGFRTVNVNAALVPPPAPPSGAVVVTVS